MASVRLGCYNELQNDSLDGFSPLFANVHLLYRVERIGEAMGSQSAYEMWSLGRQANFCPFHSRRDMLAQLHHLYS